MKKTILFLLIAVAAITLGSSCKKEYDEEFLRQAQEQEKPIGQNINASINISGDLNAAGEVIINTNLHASGAASTGPIRSYMLSWGDGTNVGTVNINSNNEIVGDHTYTQLGQFTISLKVFSGSDGSGESSFASRTIRVVERGDTTQHPIDTDFDSLLVKYDSLYIGGENIWKSYWKLNCNRAFGEGYSGTFHYKGDKNGWNLTALPTPNSHWVYFTTEGTQRFTIVNIRGSQELWARISTNVNENEHSLTKWNSFGCVDVIAKSNGTFPIKDMGSIGDQLINLSNAGGKLRINIKSCAGTFMVTTGMNPGLKINFPSGTRVVEMTKNISDPYGNYWFYDVDRAEFNGSVVFSILPNHTQPDYSHFWNSSYWSPNASSRTFTIPTGVNPPW